mmetsp:Transcript_19593/g.56405  ORF Transcript_19593/g.56405 Transcript_19593/m.56405 type:complete len:109 (+) Transcript_19593:1920-2246(+)
MDDRHDERDAGPGVSDDDEAEDALDPRREKADTAATRQQAPPAARRTADDGWDDDDDGKDEKPPPPRLGLPLAKGGILFAEELTVFFWFFQCVSTISYLWQRRQHAPT